MAIRRDPVTGVRTLRLALIASAILLAATSSVAAQTQSVTLAWDPSPDFDVAGYIVYVGVEPSTFRESFDVRNQTRFTYPAAARGVGYYFAVAAYTATRLVGPRSETVFFLGGSPTTALSDASAQARPQALTAAPATPARQDLEATVCAAGSATDCYRLQTLASLAGVVTSIAALDDGRALVIEDGQRVRVVSAEGVESQPALVARSETTLAALVTDPRFASTRAVYVSEIQRRLDGGREMAIVRYRELGGTLGEGSALVAGLALPVEGVAPFTVDSTGFLYVALPSSDGSTSLASSPYARRVLRFAPDGTVPDGSPSASPIFALGYGRPAAIAVSQSPLPLWLAGQQADWSGSLARVVMGSLSSDWPRTPEPVGAVTESASVLALRAGAGALEGVLMDAASGSLIRLSEVGSTLASTRVELPEGRIPVAAAIDAAGTIIVATRADSGQGGAVLIRLVRP